MWICETPKDYGRTGQSYIAVLDSKNSQRLKQLTDDLVEASKNLIR